MTDAPSPLPSPLPFWVSMVLPVALVAGAMLGGGWTLLATALAWWLFIGADALAGPDPANADPGTEDRALIWHRAVTLVWAPVQAATLFGLIFYLPRADHLSVTEVALLSVGLGAMSGTVGIVFAHELMHRTGRTERWLGDILMAMALYGHFRSEHLLVHHRHVGTPQDPATARRGEGFHRFLLRVVPTSFTSALAAEAERLGRAGRSPWNRRNPFWRYAALQAGMLTAALWLGGVTGLGIFAAQAVVAIWQLELVNYIEHYGLTRKHLGGGRYEPTRAHHSWNAAPWASNRLLLNLQRHSDHHVRPDRPFPLLQSYPTDVAPRLPHGYPVMTLMALVPRLWRRRMDPRVRAWRRRHYPEIEDWGPYERP